MFTPRLFKTLKFVASPMSALVKRGASSFISSSFLSTIMMSLPSSKSFSDRLLPKRPMPMIRMDFIFFSLG